MQPCPCSANNTLMSEPPDAAMLDEKEQKVFHFDVTKVLYMAKRVRQMALPAVSILAGRVKKHHQ